MKTYTIKPLRFNFVMDSDKRFESCYAVVDLDTFSILPTSDGRYIWSHTGLHAGEYGTVATFEDAKTKCMQIWIKRIERHLIEECND